jgi:hypothetical protein
MSSANSAVCLPALALRPFIVFRFERACGLIKHHRPSLAHVASACGYYDQVQMTREWNAIAGRDNGLMSEVAYLRESVARGASQ